MRGVFITGTDTGIGKTVVAASLVIAARSAGAVCYWKPIQTGIEEDNDTETVRKLAGCNNDEVFDKGFRLEKPLSPHLSARLAGIDISVAKTLQFLDQRRKTFWIVEGAGGVMVPLNARELMIDLIKAVDLPVVIVARTTLGTINHTLLTIEALRTRGLRLCGVVLNGVANSENKEAIRFYGKLPVLAEMPRFEKLDAAEVNQLSKELELEWFSNEF